MIGKKQTPSTLLGIAWESGRASVALVRREGASFEVQKTLAIDWPGSSGGGDAEVIGLAIRQGLARENIKERRCVVALPVQQVLSLLTRIPQLAEADVADFLNVEAERNFAYDLDSLYVSASRCRFASGEQYANIAGVQREQVLNIQRALQAARLKPLGFTVGIAALQKVFLQAQEPELILVLGKNVVEAGVTCGEGLFAMRSIESPEDASDVEGMGRELRVTLGQLPAELRGRVVTASLFGPPERAARMKADLAPRLRSMGVAVEAASPPAGAFAGAVAVAASYLLGKRAEFEFLPPKVSAWKEFAGKNSSRKLAWAAGMAAAVILLWLGVFLVQGWQLSKLEGRWDKMSPRVTELEAMQQQIKKFRPWFDNSFRSLTILRKLTEAFPAEGVVTAKTLEIRNQTQVTCSGVAKDNQALFRMLDQLRGTKEVADVKMDQIRGKSPLQFNFNYRWVEGGAGER